MATKNKNPYREGTAYAAIFAAIQAAKGIITRQKLIDDGFKPHDITVVLSPRDEGDVRTIKGKTADCRGNLSAQGHVYFMERLKKVKGEPQRFRLRWRKKDALQPRKRVAGKNLPSQKTQKGKKGKKAAETSETAA